MKQRGKSLSIRGVYEWKQATFAVRVGAEVNQQKLTYKIILVELRLC